MFPNCEKCPQKHRFKSFVPGGGNRNAKYIIIGQAPGPSEVGAHRCLVGKSGDFTWVTLRDQNLSRPDFYITNACKCFIREPKKDVINACRPLLVEELNACTSKELIICFGDKAFKALFPKVKGGVVKNSGKIMYSDEFKCSVLVCINPASTMYSTKLVALFRESLSRITKPVQTAPKLIAHFNEGIELVERMSGKVVAIDIETTGLDIYEPYFGITEVGLYDGETLAIFDSSYFNDARFLLALENIKFLTHNGQFDIQGIHRITGRWYEVVHDTMLMGYVHNESFGSGEDSGYGLEKLAGIYLGAPPWKSEMKKKGYRASDEEMNAYLGNDVYYTYQLYMKWKDTMREMHYRTVLIPAFNAAAHMSADGIQMDIELCIAMRKRFDKTIARLKKHLQDILGDPKYNPNSSPQNIKVASQLTGEYVTSTDESFLQAHKYMKFFQILQAYRTLAKLAGTYLTTKYVSSDGLIHPSVKIHGTETGRISMMHPNMQNVPKSVRKLFIPYKHHKWWITGDFDQLEIKVACALANLRSFIEKINQGFDIHTVTAMIMTGQKKSDYSEDKWSEIRRDAKEVNFATLYGAGLAKLVKLFTKKDPKDMKPGELAEAYKQAQAFVIKHFSDFEEWKKKLITESLNKGYVETAYQGRRRFLHIDRRNIEEVKRQIVNTIVQGTAGQRAVLCVTQLQRELPEKFGAHVINTVHDSIDVSCPDGIENEVAAYIKQVMEQPVHFTDMKFTATVKIGKRWK